MEIAGLSELVLFALAAALLVLLVSGPLERAVERRFRLKSGRDTLQRK